MKVAEKTHWNEEQVNLIKSMYAKGLDETEFETYALLCKNLGLDPIRKQVYAIKRKTKDKHGRETWVMTIQVSIEGYRSIAERTGKYAPGEETVYLYDDQKKLIGARAYVRKMTDDRTWHNVSAEAYLEEYMATYYDLKKKEHVPTQFWSKFPRVMIEKCAEARALRRCFPNELANLYIPEEMDQADSSEVAPKPLVITQDTQETEDPKISEDELKEIRKLVGERFEIVERINQKYGINSILNIKQKDFADIIKGIKAILKIEYGENHAQ